MATPMNELPKIVFSRTLAEARWNNAQISREEVGPAVTQLKRAQGGEMIAFGGARFGQTLIREGVVDEFRLTVHPVALGAGLSLWHGLPQPVRLKTLETRTYADGSSTYVFAPA